MVTVPSEDRRIRLRRLDDCLGILEQAHELDLSEVSDAIEYMLQERVPSVHTGMLISDAIEEVLRMQEPYMVQVRPDTSRRVRHRRDPFDVRTLIRGLR